MIMCVFQLAQLVRLNHIQQVRIAFISLAMITTIAFSSIITIIQELMNTLTLD